MNTEEMIRKGKLLLDSNGRSEQFSNFSRVYPMTTENIKGYYDYYDMNGKDVLTVCSSGDHIFEALLRGARHVDCFDVNKLTEYYYHFKKALILANSFKDFENILIFNLMPTGNFKEKWYVGLREYIIYPYRAFWDEIINYAWRNNLPLNRLLLSGSYNSHYYNELLSYFNEEDFILLKEILNDSSTCFIHSDLKNLGKVLDDTYDYMFLSNISDYVGVRNTADFSKAELLPFVNEGGEIAYAYMYDASTRSNHIGVNDGILSIPSILRRNENDDLVLTLKKR